MCTSISLNNGTFVFGRSMDIEYSFGERVVFTPRNFPLKFKCCGELAHHYAFIGTAAVVDGYPLYADGMNEKGLCAAALNFPESVYGNTADSGDVSAYEVIHLLLSQCDDVNSAERLISCRRIVGIPFKAGLPLSPLHWHIADKERSIVVECTAEGMKIHPNPAGVLTNSPEFSFHLNNLRQYLHLTASCPEPSDWAENFKRPIGRGFGSIGLPGDFTPASRFLRAAYLRANSPCFDDVKMQRAHLFHLLDNVSMPYGAVLTEEGKNEITLYTCCMHPESGDYRFVRYSGDSVTANLFGSELDGSALAELDTTEG